MKKLILAAVATMVSLSAFAQGVVVFNNRVIPTVDARVTFSDGSGGVAAGYTAQLFGGAEGTAVGSLTALTPTTTFRTSTAGAGYVNPPADAVAVPGVNPGSKATLVMRVYPTGGSYQAGAIGSGESNPFTVTLGGGTLPPANLEGLQAFTVNAIPEPSTIALAVIGGAALLFMRRRK